MRPVILAAALALTALPAMAQSGLRASDRPYDAGELAGMLSDHAVEYFDGSVSRYRGDGVYSYKYRPDDRPWLGMWQTGPEGAVCVVFDGGTERCDTFVDDGARMVLIIADGTRFPVRERRVLVDGY